MTYRHIVFDIDGTLLDTQAAMLTSLQKTVHAMTGREWALEEIQYTFGMTAANALGKLGVTDADAGFTLWKDFYLKDTDRVQVFPGVKAMLDGLRASAVHLGILSSKTRSEYRTDFLPYGLGDYFETVILAEDSARHKPDPAPMQSYLRRSGADPHQVIYIGDTVYDMQCARGAGADCALALWGCINPQGVEADYHLEKPGDVLESVLKIR